eukprot:4189324-Lingulodinium_polyedra.AAC.1
MRGATHGAAHVVSMFVIRGAPKHGTAHVKVFLSKTKRFLLKNGHAAARTADVMPPCMTIHMVMRVVETRLRSAWQRKFESSASGKNIACG